MNNNYEFIISCQKKSEISRRDKLMLKNIYIYTYICICMYIYIHLCDCKEKASHIINENLNLIKLNEILKNLNLYINYKMYSKNAQKQD